MSDWMKKHWLTLGTVIILSELAAAIVLFGDVR